MTGAAVKATDAASYDALGATFDRLSERHAAVFADQLVALAGVRPGERVLDVGTGTGLVARRAARLAEPGGVVVGVDLSKGMLETARARAAGTAGPEYRCMDAEALELPDGSQDRVLSLFALAHFPDPGQALAEMHRVLKPGGRLVLGVGGGPPALSSASAARAVARLAEAWRGWRGLELSAPAALEALLDRELAGGGRPPLRHPRLLPGRVAGRVRAAGFVRLHERWLGQEVLLQDPHEFWELQRSYSTRVRQRLAAASDDEIRALRAELLALAQRVLARGGRLVYRSAALFVAAERPGASGD